MTAADREAAARRQRAQTIALWRWSLIEPAMDPALTSRQCGAIVRQLAWESVRAGPLDLEGLDLRGGLSASDRKRPFSPGLMAR
jgi:hypothetical protein